ncbi:MAG: hypothetical protein KCHDKBKB_01117 [Elusimicrobia bacterium]|nr:hypothetical protein [Elusimicrobiota bacterium]
MPPIKSKSVSFSQATMVEKENRSKMLDKFHEWPIVDEVRLANLGLFVNRQSLSRMLCLNELYKKILDVHGVVMEFGVCWGRDLSLFMNLRGIYEPFNFTRKIIGFDTFSGFPSVHIKDGKSDVVKVGAASTTRNYEDFLEAVLRYQEAESPISQIKKFELVKGDASVRLKEYLKNNPETVVSFAYFDLDIYEPTKKCLDLIMKYVTKGTVLAFDEVCDHSWPGETMALKEVLGLRNVTLKRVPYCPNISYMIVD